MTMTRAWSHWKFYHRGDEFFGALVEALRKAKQSIEIETYIFETDPFTLGLLDELGEARRRGVEVRLLVDGIGSYFWLEALKDRCRELGIDLRVWQPLPRNFAGARRLLWLAGFRLIRILRQLNRRNHRKIVLIDSKVAFLGSQNWTQVHSESFMGDKAWRDSGLQVEGPAVADLQAAVAVAWKKSSIQRFRFWTLQQSKVRRYHALLSAARLNLDARNRRHIIRDVLHRIHRSKKRILIESAYFLPTRSQFRALRKAAKRGVDVRIIVPGESDVPLVKWAAHDLSILLRKAGVKIYEYQPRILHAKFYVIDDWAAIGSTNFNHRSFFHDLEVEAVFDQPEAVSELAAQWNQDLTESLPQEEVRKAPRSFWRRWLFYFAFRIRYIL